MAHWLFEVSEEYLFSTPHDTQDLPSSDENLPAAQGVSVLVPSQLDPAVHLVHAVFVESEPVVWLPESHFSHASFDASEEYSLLVPQGVQDLPFNTERVPAAQGVLELVPSQLNPAVHVAHLVFSVLSAVAPVV